MRPTIPEQARVLSLPGAEVPALVFHPEAPARAPAVLFFHGLRASKEVQRKEGRSLAEAGFAAVVVDAPHHGARRSERLEQLRAAEGDAADLIFFNMVREAADEVPGLVSLLLAEGHPAVAIAGISMGGYIALAGAVAEPRLVAVVSILGSPDWTPDSGVVAPELAEVVAADPMHRRERLVPRPLLLLNAGRDTHVRPEGARALAAALRPRYADAPGRLVHREYPEADHFMGERDWGDLWATTLAFLTRFVPRGEV